MTKKVKITVNGKPVYLNYFHDREIFDNLWNAYLKKYGGRYKVRPNEVNIWQILCVYGTVQPYSILRRELCFVGEFKSARGINLLVKKLPSFCTIVQIGDCDIVVKFSESRIHDIIDLFHVRKKRQISPEHLAKLLASSEQYRFKPSVKKQMITTVKPVVRCTSEESTGSHSQAYDCDKEHKLCSQAKVTNEPS